MNNELAELNENLNTEENIIDNNCRLSSLNFDVLQIIGENLCTDELISLCGANSMVSYAVAERLVRKLLISFDEWNRIWSTKNIFKMFGEWMKEMSIGQQNFINENCGESNGFEYYLRLIVKNCTMNRLRFLSLQFDIQEVNGDLLVASKGFFTNLREFQFKSEKPQRNGQATQGQDQFLGMIIDAAEQLEVLTVENTESGGNWLRSPTMNNIKEIVLINSLISGEENISDGPALKKFTSINDDTANDSLFAEIIKKCPNMEEFIDIQHTAPNDDFLEILNRYPYLSQGDKLKRIQITAHTRSGHDLIHFLINISRKNILEHLTVQFVDDANTTMNLNSNIYNEYPDYLRCAHFKSLKTLKIGNHSTCLFWNEMLINFISELENLEEITITSTEPIYNLRIAMIALAPPNLKIFKINQAKTADLCYVMSRIGIMKGTNEDKLTIVINSQQNDEIIDHQISDMIDIVVEDV